MSTFHTAQQHMSHNTIQQMNPDKTKILFLCTTHNSLSQRLYLDLTTIGHDVSIEYAISGEAMLEAVRLYEPDLIVCPFLTVRVPQAVYDKTLTLIVHPGPPGDAGPSALDWVLMGDDGSVDDVNSLLEELDGTVAAPGRTHWGVTVLQAIENFDAGPVWAFEQFPIDIDQAGLTKSELYRGPVTQAALVAIRKAISRVQRAIDDKPSELATKLQADPSYRLESVTGQRCFQGGKTQHRPLLKAAERDFDVNRHTSTHISRRIRSGDSQPGVLSLVFGKPVYIYGGIIEDGVPAQPAMLVRGTTTTILEVRHKAVCIAACDGRGVWFTHIRRPQSANHPALWPKVPACDGLIELGILTAAQIRDLEWPLNSKWSLSSLPTLQEIWIDFEVHSNAVKVAYLHFNFYNGAMSTDQCSRLINAMDYILAQSTSTTPVNAVVLMGGTYFSNGIALNVIETALDPAQESWLNINRIDDFIHYLLHEFPSRGILTIAAMRGNAAAGGVALAAACDIVIAGSEIVINPAYRAIGLFGSEYHTLSYYGRCGASYAKRMLRSMTPMGPFQAQRAGLVDYVFPGTGEQLDGYIRAHIAMLLLPGGIKQGSWKRKVDLSPSSLAHARAVELSEMSKDFWSARASRYHSRRFDFVRKTKPTHTPLRFAKHRRLVRGNVLFDEEETDEFDDVEYHRRTYETHLRANLHAEFCKEMELTRRSSLSGCLTPPSDKFPNTVHADPKKHETIFSCYYDGSLDKRILPPEPPLEQTTPGVEEILPVFGKCELLTAYAR